jgi:DNA polymerase-3 subunit beta
MEVSLTQEKLARALAIASRVATNKANLPVLNNVLLRVDKNQIVVAATNLEVAATTSIGAKITQPGSITVPAKIISEFVSNLPNNTIELQTKGSSLTIKSGGYSSTLNGIDADEFPELPTIEEKTSVHYSLSTQDFKQAITQTIFTCSSDVTRPVLTGVYWHSHDGWLYLVGTDGYRLAERRLVETKSELAAIVPTSTLHEVLRALGDTHEEIDILFDEAQVRFRIGEVEITSRLIDGKYPDYRKLLPEDREPVATVKTTDLVRTTKIASLFARESGGSITLSTDKEQQKVSIESVASDVGENTSQIDAVISTDGKVSLNSRYLAEVLSVIDADELTVSFSGKLAPIVLASTDKNSDYTHIIMPLKS